MCTTLDDITIKSAQADPIPDIGSLYATCDLWVYVAYSPIYSTS